MKDTLQRYWMERPPRERWIMGVGTAIVALAVLYAYLWLPMARERERLMTDLPRLRVEAQEMRAGALQIERLRTSPAGVPNDLRAVVTSVTARQQGSRMAPQMSTETNGRVRVAFASVPAKEWQSWIAALSAERGIRIDAVQIDALDAPGLIKASAILSSGS